MILPTESGGIERRANSLSGLSRLNIAAFCLQLVAYSSMTIYL